MKFSIFRILTVFLVVLFALPLISRAQTDFSIGDAANYAVLYEGNGQQLQYNNSFVTGNIGIGSINGTTGQFQGNGPGTITGTVEFNNSTGAFSNSGLLITGNSGNPLYNQTNINTDLTNLNSLSNTLRVETGTAAIIAGGGSITASSGMLDGSGNRVFAGSLDGTFTNGTTFTINGGANDYVVINVASTGGHGFNGNVVLAGGITADHVLFNLDAGNYATQTGGDTLTISTNGGITTGIFLDPNGNIQINNSVLDGRIFGGDTQNLSIVSGATINAPTVTPEPASMLLFGTGLLALGGVLRRRLTPVPIA